MVPTIAVRTQAAGPDECELDPIATGIAPPGVFSRGSGFEEEHRGVFAVFPAVDGQLVLFVDEAAVVRRTGQAYLVVPFVH